MIGTILWIVLGWIFLHVIVKLFVNSIERIYKNKIDNVVLKIHSTTKIIFIQIIRILMIIFYAPIIIISFFIPHNNYRLSFFIVFRDSVFSKKFPLRLAFGIAFFDKQKRQKLIEEEVKGYREKYPRD